MPPSSKCKKFTSFSPFRPANKQYIAPPTMAKNSAVKISPQSIVGLRLNLLPPLSAVFSSVACCGQSRIAEREGDYKGLVILANAGIHVGPLADTRRDL